MRLDYIDNAKAIAILLVVVGHTDGIPHFLETFIYSFHMPAFFFLSGYLLKDSKLEITFKSYAGIQFRNLIIPYLFFAVLSLLYSILNNFVTGNPIDLYSKLLGIAYGNSDGLVINRVLWFFTCLFITSLLFYLLFKAMKKAYLVMLLSLIACLLFLFYHKPDQIRWPWNLDLSIIALFFYAAGKFCSAIHIKNDFLKKSGTRIAFVILLSIALFYLSKLNGRIDMAFMVFKNPLLFVANACIGIALVLLWSLLLPPTKIARFLSRNTIVIFPLHPLIFSIFTAVGMMIFKLPHSFQATMLFAGIYTCGAIILCYPASLLLFNFLPIAVGGRKKL